MMYEDLPKRIPFVTDNMGRTIEFYLYKLAQIKTGSNNSNLMYSISEENYFDELLSHNNYEY